MTLKELKDKINNSLFEKLFDNMTYYSYDIDKINDELEKASNNINLDPNNNDWYYFRGCHYFGLEDFENSVKEIKIAIQILEKKYDIKENNFLDNDKNKKSNIKEKLFRYSYGLGMIYYKARDYENSVESFSNALNYFMDGNTLCKRGKSYLMLNRLENALSDWSKALNIENTTDREEYLNYYEELIKISKNINYEYLFIDDRDNQYYRVEKIGDQLWMADNFNYNIDGSTEYTIETLLGKKKYGRYYDWETAQLACPKGWKLPTKEDYCKLFRYINDDEKLGHKLVESGDSGFDALFLGSRTKNSLKLELLDNIWGGEDEKNIEIEKEWKVYKNIWGLHKSANFWTSSKENDKFPFQLIISDGGLLNIIKTQKKEYSKIVYLTELSNYNLISMEVAFEQLHPCHGINVRYVKHIK